MAESLGWDDVEQLMAELKDMARRLLRKESAAIQTTSLVNATLRRQKRADQDWSSVTWLNRRYFFGAMHLAMARELKNRARARRALKQQHEILLQPQDFTLFNVQGMLEKNPDIVVALVEALARLEQQDPACAECIQHRVYEGLTLAETAQMMNENVKKIQRLSDKASLYLKDEIQAILHEPWMQQG